MARDGGREEGGAASPTGQKEAPPPPAQLPSERRLGFSRYDGCQMSATSCEDGETGTGLDAGSGSPAPPLTSPSDPDGAAKQLLRRFQLERFRLRLQHGFLCRPFLLSPSAYLLFFWKG